MYCQFDVLDDEGQWTSLPIHSAKWAARGVQICFLQYPICVSWSAMECSCQILFSHIKCAISMKQHPSSTRSCTCDERHLDCRQPHASQACRAPRARVKETCGHHSKSEKAATGLNYCNQLMMSQRIWHQPNACSSMNALPCLNPSMYKQ